MSRVGSSDGRDCMEMEIMISGGAGAQTNCHLPCKEMDNANQRATWQRDSRTFVYLAERRARYASITRNAEGRLLVLFTHQTEEQEKNGSGDLFLVRRTKDGDWWFYPETIYEAREGEPRAYGTMTSLRSGKLIAPFAELDDRAGKSIVRILLSPDGGESWSASAPLATDPLVWAAPYWPCLLTPAGLRPTVVVINGYRHHDTG